MRVDLVKNTLQIYTDHADPAEVAAIKSLPYRRFQPAHKRWLAPYIRQTHEAWVKVMPWPEHIDPPTSSGATVRWSGKTLVLRTPYSQKNVALSRALPGRRKWSKALTAWLVWPTIDNVRYIGDSWPYAEWSEAASEVRDEVMAKVEVFKEAAEQKSIALAGAHDVDWEFGTEPFTHQRAAFAMSRDRDVFALFMEQGTGKTKIVVDNACYLYEEDRIDAVVVVCPNSVKSTWEEEVEVHAPDRVPVETAVYSSQMRADDKRQFEHVTQGEGRVLRFLVLNVESFSKTDPRYHYGRGKKRVSNKVSKGEAMAGEFMAQHRCMFVVDESSRIKTPNARRTKGITRVGRLAPYRRILSGTPITQGALDIWAQFRFLDPDILESHSFYAFKNRVALVDQWGRVDGYKPGALEALHAMIDPHSYRVTKDECLDLPPKVFEKRFVEMSPEQDKLYRQMRSKMYAELSETEQVTATIVLTQMLRLQQIVGGFAPVEDPFTLTTKAVPIKGTNPKVQAVLDLAEDSPDKMIVWARFVPEIEAVAAALARVYGEGAVAKFYGPTPEAERTSIRRRFQDAGDPLRFFVGNQATGGLGLTLTRAPLVVYFSNSFSLEDRLQSEDRAHRIGQDRSVVYVDLIAKGTIDQKVVAALRSKKKVASIVTGDEWRDWI